MLNGHDRASDALHAIPPDLARDGWVKAGMAFHAAGGDLDTFDAWSAQAGNYDAQACRATWRSFKAAPGGVGAATLFGMARDHGWQDGNAKPRQAPAKPTTRRAEPPRKPASGNSASEVFNRCEPATDRHGYVIAKGAQGASMDALPTVTGPGHASIYTGTTPSHHGIVANDRYDRATRKTIYCTQDMSQQAVGTLPDNAHRSPVQLHSTTLADELERRTERRSKTIGVALKDRSSILPIGRTGDAAYWMYATEGNFITSTWYMKALPQWVADFNSKKLAEQYLAQTWSLTLPVERYHQVLPDNNPYEIPLYRGIPASLPINLDSLRKAGAGLDLLSYTPWGNTITTDMALAALYHLKSFLGHQVIQWVEIYVGEHRR